MQARMEKQLKIQASMCDNKALISVPSLFTLFMDLACEHAAELKIGFNDLAPKGLFWLAVRTKVQIISRPEMLCDVTAVTWPEKPGKVSCNRYYKLCKDGKAVALGKSEWAVIDLASNKLKRLNEVYPEDIEHCEQTVCDGPYMRIIRDFSDYKEIGQYKIRSCDIDLGQHMNNVAYVKALFSMFSCEEIDRFGVKEAEIAFRTQCREGQTLTVKAKQQDNVMDIVMLCDDKTVGAVAKLTK